MTDTTFGKSERVKEIRDWINFYVTVLIIPVGGAVCLWAWWSFNQIIERQRTTIETGVAANYVSKTWFENSESETNKRLDSLGDSMNKVQMDVSQIKGQLEPLRK